MCRSFSVCVRKISGPNPGRTPATLTEGYVVTSSTSRHAGIVYSGTPLIRTRVIRIANCPKRLEPSGKFVQNYTKLTCLEITGHRIKYSTVLWLLELKELGVVERFRRRYVLQIVPYFPAHKTHRPIRRTLNFSLEILEKNNDECILILVIYWKKTELLHTKISNHNVIHLS